MSSSKRENVNIPITSTNIILDIEGTTTSITFVKDVLFPYVREHLEAYVKENWDSEDFQAVVNALKTQAIEDAEAKLDGVIEIPKEGEKDTLVKAVIENVIWQMDHDRKTKSLKDLQGLIMENGYKKGELKGHVYDDVRPSLESWTEQEKSVYIYSSGSVHAQKLLFGHSEKGDLLPFIKQHFDTTVGMKGDVESYKKIVKEISCSPSEAVFFTDVPKEARAAKEAGLLAVLLSREGNAPLTKEDESEFEVITSFFEIQFENQSKKRKVCDENKSFELCEVYVKTPKEQTNPTVTQQQDADMEVEESSTEVKDVNVEVPDKTVDDKNSQEITTFENGDIDMETSCATVQEKKNEMEKEDVKLNNGLATELHDEVAKGTKSESESTSDCVILQVTTETKKNNEGNENSSVRPDELSVPSNANHKEPEKSVSEDNEVRSVDEETVTPNSINPSCEAEISSDQKEELKESNRDNDFKKNLHGSSTNINDTASKEEENQTDDSVSEITKNECVKSSLTQKTEVESLGEETVTADNGSPTCETEMSIDQKEKLKESDQDNLEHLAKSAHNSSSVVNPLGNKEEENQTNVSVSEMNKNECDKDSPTQKLEVKNIDDGIATTKIGSSSCEAEISIDQKEGLKEDDCDIADKSKHGLSTDVNSIPNKEEKESQTNEENLKKTVHGSSTNAKSRDSKEEENKTDGSKSESSLYEVIGSGTINIGSETNSSSQEIKSESYSEKTDCSDSEGDWFKRIGSGTINIGSEKTDCSDSEGGWFKRIGSGTISIGSETNSSSQEIKVESHGEKAVTEINESSLCETEISIDKEEDLKEGSHDNVGKSENASSTEENQTKDSVSEITKNENEITSPIQEINTVIETKVTKSCEMPNNSVLDDNGASSNSDGKNQTEVEQADIVNSECKASIATETNVEDSKPLGYDNSMEVEENCHAKANDENELGVVAEDSSKSIEANDLNTDQTILDKKENEISETESMKESTTTAINGTLAADCKIENVNGISDNTKSNENEQVVSEDNKQTSAETKLTEPKITGTKSELDKTAVDSKFDVDMEIGDEPVASQENKNQQGCISITENGSVEDKNIKIQDSADKIDSNTKGEIENGIVDTMDLSKNNEECEKNNPEPSQNGKMTVEAMEVDSSHERDENDENKKCISDSKKCVVAENAGTVVTEVEA